MSKKQNSKILDKLGLTKEEVRAAFSLKAPESEKKPKKGYLFRADQNRMSKRMKRWDSMIYARFMGGMHPKIIAKVIGVSEESVRVRLRKAKFFSN